MYIGLYVATFKSFKYGNCALGPNCFNGPVVDGTNGGDWARGGAQQTENSIIIGVLAKEQLPLEYEPLLSVFLFHP